MVIKSDKIWSSHLGMKYLGYSYSLIKCNALALVYINTFVHNYKEKKSSATTTNNCRTNEEEI